MLIDFSRMVAAVYFAGNYWFPYAAYEQLVNKITEADRGRMKLYCTDGRNTAYLKKEAQHILDQIRIKQMLRSLPCIERKITRSKMQSIVDKAEYTFEL